jgi:hypothetical protein
MALTCGDRESPSEMMRLIAVAGNCVLLSAVVTGVCPSCAPVKSVGGLTALISYIRRSWQATGLDAAEQDPVRRCRVAGYAAGSTAPTLDRSWPRPAPHCLFIAARYSGQLYRRTAVITTWRPKGRSAAPPGKPRRSRTRAARARKRAGGAPSPGRNTTGRSSRRCRRAAGRGLRG